jgi:hypothetical protein
VLKLRAIDSTGRRSNTKLVKFWVLVAPQTRLTRGQRGRIGAELKGLDLALAQDDEHALAREDPHVVDIERDSLRRGSPRLH